MWFLSVMLIIIIILVILFIVFVMKERRIYQSIIAKVYTHPEVITSNLLAILFLSYKSEVFQAVDRLLENTDNEQYIVVFSAPDWLIPQKKRKWIHHIVLNAKELGWEFEDVSIIQPEVQSKRGGVTKIKQVIEYLENTHVEERGKSDGVQYPVDARNPSHSRTFS